MTAPIVRGTRPPGFRLPDATHVGRVRLAVSSLARSLPFYAETLGFRVLAREDGVARLGAHGDERVLVELHEDPRARPIRPHARLGLYHFAILVPDRAALGRFVEHLARTGTRAGASDHLVSEALYLGDPDGLGIEVYADRPRAAWRWEGGQVAMTTEPLDLAALVRAADGAPWTGMPAGTTIGHVHLHVGDLDGASAFYHAALGLDAVVWGYPGALFLSAGGYHHHLGTNVWARGAPPADETDARLLDWELVLPDESSLAAAVESLTSAGHAVENAGADVLARDPWGTPVRLVRAA